ncbi:MAG: right-handed parallel beta-helix repeat-containing protein [Deltaproteobacteria bacterium]|nr:right-handed parallel beta-helix repeat-containing protein [Deltaproteobacteria bacterium]
MRLTHRSAVVAWLVAAACGCTDGGTGGADVAQDADGEEEVQVDAPAIDPPAPPAPPLLTPCPEGWREVTESGSEVATCEPWPEGGPQDCTGDQAHFPGEPGCVTVGSACPTGDWAELPPGGDVVYVLAGAPPGGDGTRASPFGTIADAVAAATTDAVIALSKGTFDEPVAVDRTLTFWGACTAETTVTSSVADDRAAVFFATAGHLTVRNLRVTGERAGIVAGPGVGLTVQGVIIEGARVLGLYAAGAAPVVGTDLVVRDTRHDAAGGYGLGLNAEQHADVTLTRCAFERNRTAGIRVSSGSHVVLTDVAVRDTAGDGAGRMGRGIAVQDGGQVEVTRGALESNREAGVLASTDAVVGLTDVVIRGTEGQEADRAEGRGLHAQNRAQVTVTRGQFLANRKGGLYASSEASLVLQDVVIRDTRSEEASLTEGRGVVVVAPGEAELRRVLLERNRELAVGVSGAGAVMHLEDVIVRDTLAQEIDLAAGRALDLENGATVDLARALLSGNREVTVFVAGAGTSATFADLEVQDTRESDCGCPGGIGIGAYAGGHFDLTRFRIHGQALCGVQLAHGADLDDIPFAEGGTADMRDGEIYSQPIGVNIQTDGFDPSRLADRVALYDNEEPVDMSTEVPVPTVDTGGL